MAYDDDLKFTPENNVKNGHDSNGRDSDARDSGAVGSIGCSGDSASIDGIDDGNGNGDVEDFGTSGKGRGSDGDSRVLSIGIGGRKSGRRSARSRPGSGGNSGGGSDSANSGNSSDATRRAGSAQDARSTGDNPPREVSYRSLRGKSNAADVAISQQFVSEVWQMIFSLAAVVTHDDEWKIGDDDATELSTRSVALFKGLDRKRADKIEKQIARFAPSLSLLMAVLMIVGPRLAHTRQLRKSGAVNIRKENESGGAANRPANPTPSPRYDAPVSGAHANGNGGAGSGNATITPFGREDFRTLYGEDDSGAM